MKSVSLCRPILAKRTAASRAVEYAPKTPRQQIAFDLLTKKDVAYTFITGPAGTGKTMLACHVAADAIARGTASRIVVTRPAVSAGEDHGFLPGSIDEKMDPWIRTLTNPLEERFGISASTLARDGVLEICPLAYMRGRTFKDSVVILDEAQNASAMQLKMCMTRLGEGSRMIVTGDPAQSDLEHAALARLVDRLMAARALEHVQLARFENSDILRHPAIGEILSFFDS